MKQLFSDTGQCQERTEVPKRRRTNEISKIVLTFCLKIFTRPNHREGELKKSTDKNGFSEMTTQRMEFKLAKASGICFMEYWRRGSYTESSSKNLLRCSFEPVAKYQGVNKCGEIPQGWEKATT